MTSATEELRRLLDERGVKWEDASPVPSSKQWKTSFTSFTGEEVTLGCYDDPKWIMGMMVFHTPEQAVEATLGRGTCHNTEQGNIELRTGMPVFFCSECGEFYVIDSRVYYCPSCGAKVVE